VRGALLLGLLLPVAFAQMGWADETTAAKCCDQSSTECRTGQSVGDKGSCTGSQVCVQIADKCKKKHPGVFCSCGTKESNLGVSATTLTFDKKSRKGTLTVSNAGNVPLDLTVTESGETEAFAIHRTHKCKQRTVSAGGARQELRTLSGYSTGIVAPQGCATFRVRFTAKKAGVYSVDLVIQSDATNPPMAASVALLGSLGSPGTLPSTTTSSTTTTTLGSSGCTSCACVSGRYDSPPAVLVNPQFGSAGSETCIDTTVPQLANDCARMPPPAPVSVTAIVYTVGAGATRTQLMTIPSIVGEGIATLFGGTSIAGVFKGTQPVQVCLVAVNQVPATGGETAMVAVSVTWGP